MQNTPNPFHLHTTMSFSLPNSDFVELYISDIQGKRVKTLLRKQLPAGIHHIEWNGANEQGTQCNSGVYYVTIKIKSGIMSTRKVVKVGYGN